MNRSFTLKALAAAIILASTTGMVFAKGYKGDYKGEACPPPQMLKTGWYVGGQVGYDSYRFRSSYNDTAIATSSVYNATGWVGGLMLGYGMMMNDWFYLGGEVFGNWSGASETNTVVAGADSASLKNESNANYGLGLLPGIKMTDSTLTYVRLGWNWANLKTVASNVTTSASKSNTSNGFVFGVGMETLIVDNWSLRGEFDHTWYNSYNVGTAPITGTINPSDNQYMLGLLYHFA